MTWKNIIDNNLHDKFIEKAEKAKGIYVVYSAKAPYLPIDFGYSLYELYIRLGIPLNSLLTILHTGCISRCYKISIKYVYIAGNEFSLED
ncbi:MAG: hypothetical protein E7678_02925 [Ruminococcaceae bacterium]|nr:hypothetical protein [Oscillospiraceae bacterium]